MVCLLILVAIPVLALGTVILLVALALGLLRALFHTGRSMPERTTEPTPHRGGQTDFGPSRVRDREDDSMRENVKVIRR